MTDPRQNKDLSSAVELGRWMGRRDAFALIAGRCSAAEAESLRRLRESREYLLVCRSWGEFCTTHLGISRRHVDRMLGYLKEFGPEYFVMAQITHVTADEYRAIAPHVTEEGLRWDGVAIALIPENSRQLTEGVKELLKQERPAKAKESVADAVLKRLKAAVEAVCALEGELDYDQKRRLGSYVYTLLEQGKRRAIMG